jgi:hypothetical protein
LFHFIPQRISAAIPQARNDKQQNSQQTKELNPSFSTFFTLKFCISVLLIFSQLIFCCWTSTHFIKLKNDIKFYKLNLGNLSKDEMSFSVAFDGNYTDYMSGEKVSFSKNQKLTFKPWEYKILIAE